ncbi:MAG TPA: flagellar basal body rod protein FlgC [Candidatus Binataceae bacterium]|nr:flagellar basal body rod protein FlgC [Candidatus Binataceae bacterium]
MSVEATIGIANSALTAQSQRITLIAQNLANADSVNTPEGGPYQRRIPVFQAEDIGDGANGGTGVKLAAVLKDNAPAHEIFDPSSPFANADGVVKEPNVDPVYEMVDMMQAARSYQANLSVIQSAHSSALKTLDLLK